MWTVSFHLLLFWRNRKQGHLLSEENEGEGDLRRERKGLAVVLWDCGGVNGVGKWAYDNQEQERPTRD